MENIIQPQPPALFPFLLVEYGEYEAREFRLLVIEASRRSENKVTILY